MGYLSFMVVLVVALVGGSNSTFAKTKNSDEKKSTSYFACLVKEKSGRKRVDVTVKFAISNFDAVEGKGSLETYPGANEDEGEAILVTPKMLGESYAIMTNLNGQGGDLRLGRNIVKLWGDGDGYQFTDLVIWDVEDDDGTYEGYVRDYGPAYGTKETFKQFIKCKKSKNLL